jgi:hypothetical protein
MTKYYRYERVLGAMKRFSEKIALIHDGVEAYYPPISPGPEETDLTYLAYPIPKSQGNDPNSLQDYVLAFFIFCHHLTDWMINDKDIDNEVRSKIKTAVGSSVCLRFAADIANGAKHMERNRPPLSQTQPEWLRTESKVKDVIIDGYLRRIVSSSGYILTDEGEKNAYDLASECVATWEDIIRENFK